jgi:hypothetical protein
LGDRVLVLGGGQRGLCCAAAAHEAGAAQIIVTGLSRDAHKLALAPLFGATDCIDTERTDTVEAVYGLTGGVGVDLVVDTVPGAVDPIRHAIEVLTPGGTLVTAGVRRPLVDAFPLERFRSKQLHLVGVSGTTSWAVRNAIRVIASRRFPFHRLQSHVFGLDRAGDAIGTLGGQFPGEEPIHVVVRPTLRSLPPPPFPAAVLARVRRASDRPRRVYGLRQAIWRTSSGPRSASASASAKRASPLPARGCGPGRNRWPGCIGVRRRRQCTPPARPPAGMRGCPPP